MDEESSLRLFDELASGCFKKLLSLARQIIPNITEEDVLQPFDFPKLEQDPEFRYLEGMYAGILSARMAFLAKMRENAPEPEVTHIVF